MHSSYSLLWAAQACHHAALQHQVVLANSAPAAATHMVIQLVMTLQAAGKVPVSWLTLILLRGGVGVQARSIILTLAKTAPGDNATMDRAPFSWTQFGMQ